MYIDKKSIPEIIKNEINMKKLTELLTSAMAEYDSFEYSITYDNLYIINLENTYGWHKTRGMKWKCVGAKRIYKIEENRIFSYSV